MDLDIENDGDIHSWQDMRHIAFSGYKLFLWLSPLFFWNSIRPAD